MRMYWGLKMQIRETPALDVDGVNITFFFVHGGTILVNQLTIEE